MRMLVIVSLGLLGGATAAAAAANDGLAGHRAIYDLTLKDASERSGIEGMAGRLVYEFVGSACDGYKVSTRFVTEINMGEDLRLTDQQTTTFEDIRQRKFDFATRFYVNQSLDHEIKGKADISQGDLNVHLDHPEKKDLDLATALFPTEHLIELIEKAESGETFYQSRIFDGSDNADATMMTTTVIGERETADAGDKEAGNAGELSEEGFWPVAISYFDEKKEGDLLPSYFITFKLYENGVTRDLTMDYGDFVLEGKLTKLEMIAPAPCKE